MPDGSQQILTQRCDTREAGRLWAKPALDNVEATTFKLMTRIYFLVFSCNPDRLCFSTSPLGVYLRAQGRLEMICGITKTHKIDTANISPQLSNRDKVDANATNSNSRVSEG